MLHLELSVLPFIVRLVLNGQEEDREKILSIYMSLFGEEEK